MERIQTLYHDLTHPLWQAASIAEYYLRNTYTLRVLANFWDLAAQLWYFVVLGALFSTLAWRYLPKTRIRRTLQQRANGSIVASTLLALISPLCTFAAIPVAGRLINMGVPAAPLVAFVVASPLMNPALFVYTAGTISMEMAVARLVTAASVGLLAGFVAQSTLRRLTFTIRTAVPAESSTAKTDGRSEARILAQRFRGDLLFIAKFFGLGIFIAALVKTFLSQELVLALVGPGSVWAVPLAVALGVPLYACGGGSIPIVESMMQMGMSPGAALGFFIAGPATKFSTLTMLGAVWGRRILLFYLSLMLVGALFWGFLYPFGGENIQAKTGGVYEELMGQ
ncbi:MAG: permease [Gemmatimonadota bacterium]|nr:permease [Gemmatimonadota bacterium]